MFLLKTVTPEEATGSVADAYAIFPKEFGVPLPLQLFSASPALLERQSATIRYYMSHPRLTFPLLAAIRYVVASRIGYQFCADLNGGLLLKMGMSAEELASLATDPANSPLDEREAVMFALIVKALEEPSSVTEADMEGVRGHGFTDGDILDAMSHAANMTAGALLYKTFARG